MLNKKILGGVVLTILISSVAVASFVEAFAKNDQQEVGNTINNTGTAKQKESLATVGEFKLWLASYKGVSSAEKNIAFGMLEQNTTKAESYFAAACNKGDERGCFQLAINQIAQAKPEGLDHLSELALKGKNKELSIKSAQLLGAYVLDFAPNNRSAVAQGLEAVLPHSIDGDASSQFLAAHLFAANKMMAEADSMLTKACNNPEAELNIIEYCRSGGNIEMVNEDGIIIENAKKESGSCGK